MCVCLQLRSLSVNALHAIRVQFSYPECASCADYVLGPRSIANNNHGSTRRLFITRPAGIERGGAGYGWGRVSTKNSRAECIKHFARSTICKLCPKHTLKRNGWEWQPKGIASATFMRWWNINGRCSQLHAVRLCYTSQPLCHQRIQSISLNSLRTLLGMHCEWRRFREFGTPTLACKFSNFEIGHAIFQNGTC